MQQGQHKAIPLWKVRRKSIHFPLPFLILWSNKIAPDCTQLRLYFPTFSAGDTFKGVKPHLQSLPLGAYPLFRSVKASTTTDNYDKRDDVKWTHTAGVLAYACSLNHELLVSKLHSVQPCTSLVHSNQHVTLCNFTHHADITSSGIVAGERADVIPPFP